MKYFKNFLYLIVLILALAAVSNASNSQNNNARSYSLITDNASPMESQFSSSEAVGSPIIKTEIAEIVSTANDESYASGVNEVAAVPKRQAEITGTVPMMMMKMKSSDNSYKDDEAVANAFAKTKIAINGTKMQESLSQVELNNAKAVS